MQSEVSIGTLVGGFRIVSLIGEGAMGRVYLAEDVRDQRRVALEVRVPELARDERFRQRFRASRDLHRVSIIPMSFRRSPSARRTVFSASTHRVLWKTGFGSAIWDIAFAGGSAWVCSATTSASASA